MELIEDRLPPAIARPRFRFGLKTVFVVTTMLCLWLGYKAALERRAAEIVNRHNQVADVVIHNVAIAPPGTVYTLIPGNEKQLRANIHWSKSLMLNNRMVSSGYAGRIMDYSLKLDPSQIQTSLKPEAIVAQIADHYAKGLKDIRMYSPWSSTEPKFYGGVRTQVIWASLDNDLFVVIDIQIDNAVSAAVVSIQTIDAQQSQLW